MLSNWTQKIVELAQSIIGLSNIPDSQKMLKWAFIISNKKDKLVHLSLWLLTSVFMYTSILYRYWKAPIYAYVYEMYIREKFRQCLTNVISESLKMIQKFWTNLICSGRNYWRKNFGQWLIDVICWLLKFERALIFKAMFGIGGILMLFCF